ncbi:hypothetical protein A5761_07125 [Mycolicibacterium setense]|uniref:hypothetical protein n=1 Tax=Mycolicibacterium setense TaxID=431269 RepID=UPI0007EBEB67|nr:hypothetical protein [Mycolicibacterium setense]OBB19098.1 hypothetical protein A5761_07125 [Mycolicibacterium setense]
MKGQDHGGTVAYRLHVIADDAAELVTRAGGLIVDRMMSGWRVTVQLVEGSRADHARPVQILGAELVDADAISEHQDDEECVLVLGADAYEQMTSAEGRQSPIEWAEVLVWDESEGPEPAQLIGHDLSAAAQAFKALAMAAAGVPGGQVAVAELFTSMAAGSGEVTLRA